MWISKFIKTKKVFFENKYVKFLQDRDFEPLQIADLFKSNPNAFSGGNLSSDKISYLEYLLNIEGIEDVEDRDGKLELNWMLQSRSFAGIMEFKIYKNKEGFYENKYVKFLQDRGLKPLQIADIFKSNPEAFSGGDLSSGKISYLEDILTIKGIEGVKDRDGKLELNWVIRNRSFQGIVDFKIYKNKEGFSENKYIKFLQDRDIEPLQIADLFKSNPRAFSMGDLSSDKISYLEDILTIKGIEGVEDRDGKLELNWVLQNKSFQGIVDFKIYKNKDGFFENKYVKFLQDRGFEPVQIADLFKSNPNAFSGGDFSSDKISYLEDILTIENIEGVEDRDGRLELNWVIQNRSFQSIVNFKIYKNKDGFFENKYVKFLQDRDFEPLQIADIFKSNPNAFSGSDLSSDKISYLEKYLGKGDQKKGKKKLDQIILKKGGFRALGLFDYNSHAQVKNRVIDFLENSMRFHQDQVIQIIEDHFSELFVEGLTEMTSEDYIERIIQKIPEICQKSLS